MTKSILTQAVSCTACGYTSHDLGLIASHSCDVQLQGGRCEDFPCCGHEFGDCNGLLYGSDEAIKSDPHVLCDHEQGICEVDEDGDIDQYDGDDGSWEVEMYNRDLEEQSLGRPLFPNEY